MATMLNLRPRVAVPNPAAIVPCSWGVAGRGAIFSLLILAALVLPARAMDVIDALGRRVTVATPVRRIVVLNSDALEILRLLKAQERVVATHAETSREPAFWGRLADLPKTGGWRTPNLEAIAAFDPDLVLAYSRHPGKELDRKMAALGIAVLRLDFYKLNTLETEILSLGRLLDREDEARAYCNWHASHLALIRERVAGVPRQTTVFIESYSELSTTGPGSGAHEMCILSGGRNVAGDMALPYPKVTPEWVVAQSPEVIVKAASWGNGYEAVDAAFFNTMRDTVMARPVWSETPAVQNSRVHVMDSAIWTGPGALVGMAWLGRWFYPEIFADVNPVTWHKDYLHRFQGIPHQGVYVSDPLSQVNH